MRIIHIYDGRIHKTKLHYDFVRLLANYHELYLYGPKDSTNEKEHYIDNSKFKNIKDLVSEYKPDVFLTNMKENTDDHLPKGYEEVRSVPRIHIEIDYWTHLKKGKKVWYQKNADLLIQRGIYDLDEMLVPSVWLPFAADTNRFFIDTESKKERINKIIFIGSSVAPIYEIRRKAKDKLVSAKLLYDKGLVFTDAYEKQLREYKGMLSCSANLRHSPPTKIFEGMASGTAILTNYFRRHEDLFGTDEKLYFEYKDDCSDVEKVAQELLNNHDKKEEITRKAHEIVHFNHTVEHRVEELCNIIENFVKSGKIIRKWNY